MKNCPTPEETSLYADGELPPDRARALADHLRECPACREFGESLAAARRALQSVDAAADAPSAAGCPDEESLLAYADGSLRSGERERIAAHLAGCKRCSPIAASAGQTVRLCRKLEEEGSENPPAAWTERARERFFPSRPDPLGEIAVRLSELRRIFQKGPAYRLCASEAAPSLFEDSADFLVAAPSSAFRPGPDEKAAVREGKSYEAPRPGRRGRDWTFSAPDCRVGIGIAATAEKAVSLRVRLSDAEGKPLSGVTVDLEAPGVASRDRRTGKSGGLEFRDLPPGSYRLVIRLDPPKSIVIALQ